MHPPPRVDAWTLFRGYHEYIPWVDALYGSATYLPEDYAESAGLLGRGAIRTADFVTATRPLAQVAEAFELASSGQHVKVLVSVGEPTQVRG